ncbi:MAG: putative transporter [Prolixibacteraceae bacterium]|jgi:putative transport protein|nr:putative transporter [Prolixibacteraceae bacterium]MDI9564558.1 putative transporter [Bacteroidota bacterium]NLS98920.1 putative transporter [Bacteroidales bacterium]OQB79240.1 MAG: Aspartate/alanine antiporter [Bacteroidetes bacterium ADurb.Bin123]HNZ69120.1 putative transporter [Prolixibacteraceae bacterium]
MEWFRTLLFSEGIAHTILLYSLAIWLGVLLGKVKIVGISLGPTFVLFVGLFIGHLGFTVNHEVAEFVREFGLILFIYSIGLQVGPGFFSSFKRGGMQLNLMAAGIVLLGVGVTILLFYLLNGRVSMPMLVGVMSGAVTNTPGLGAAQEALKQAFEAGQLAEIPQIALGYAVAYPLAVVGIILSMVVIRLMFRINIEQEEQALEASGEVQADKPEIMTLRLTNKALSGRKLHEIKDLVGRSFVISRMMRQGHYSIPRMDSILQEGDLLLVITATADVEPVTVFMGEKVEMDWEASEKQLVSRRIVITRSEINGKTLGSLRLRTLYGVNITRVHRSGVDLLGNPNLVLQVGDRVMVVGELGDIEKVEKFLGNTLKRLDEPHIITLFIGIFLGILIGSIPFFIPGIPMPVKLGLAGGPLIVSILIGRFGFKLKLITYTTQSANFMLREIGITLFLASVGLMSGGQFAETVFSGDGLLWIGLGFLITILPLLIMGFVARKFAGLNYFILMGLLAGSTTDPPALSYAGSIANNDQPAVSYSTVYPLTMFLRVILAQLLILAFV